MAVGQNRKTPTFSKLMNFGPHISHFWKALGQGYKSAKFCGPKFKNGGDIMWGGKIRKTPIISKTNFMTPIGDECDR